VVGETSSEGFPSTHIVHRRRRNAAWDDTDLLWVWLRAGCGEMRGLLFMLLLLRLHEWRWRLSAEFWRLLTNTSTVEHSSVHRIADNALFSLPKLPSSLSCRIQCTARSSIRWYSRLRQTSYENSYVFVFVKLANKLLILAYYCCWTYRRNLNRPVRFKND